MISAAALHGIVVLDLTQFEAGTACTEMLAWLGATVIKLERPGTGEQGRGASVDQPGADSYSFIILNANKKSATLNINHPEGKALLRRLIAQADVFIENFRPGTIERIGFDYETVRGINPRIIYAQIKGFGSDGPYAQFPAFDAIGQAVGGAASITGEADGAPMHAGSNIADNGAGIHCALGIIAALYQRTNTGIGQRIEVAMQDVVISFSRSAWGRQLATGEPAPRVGNGMPMAAVAPCGAYACRGGGPNDYIFIYTSRHPGSRQWENLLQVIGRADLLNDARFTTPESRYEHRDEVDALIEAWTREHTKVEAMQAFGRADVPAGAVLTTAELSADDYLKQRGAMATMPHPTRGPLVMPGFPIQMSASSVPITPAPLLGQHTAELYEKMLGLGSDELERLRKSGAI